MPPLPAFFQHTHGRLTLVGWHEVPDAHAGHLIAGQPNEALGHLARSQDGSVVAVDLEDRCRSVVRGLPIAGLLFPQVFLSPLDEKIGRMQQACFEFLRKQRSHTIVFFRIVSVITP